MTIPIHDLPMYDFAENASPSYGPNGNRRVKMMHTDLGANAQMYQQFLELYRVQEHVDVLTETPFSEWHKQQRDFEPLIRFLADTAPSICTYDPENNPDAKYSLPWFRHVIFPSGLLHLHNMYPRVVSSYKYSYSNESHTFVVPTCDALCLLRFNTKRTQSLKDTFLAGIQQRIDTNNLKTIIQQMVQSLDSKSFTQANQYASLYAAWACWMHCCGQPEDLAHVRTIQNVVDHDRNVLNPQALRLAVAHTVLRDDPILPLEIYEQ